ncbi:hypothetical protein DMN91_007449 [Ooceraea biroi]|uniref:Myb/SANT-like DNA-binding domain-containing protein n=1 Tax=Ooceraea biroi TaxID=2015173 RepID=A0A3L8DK57_OOCBI|nr:hypothetical protein DMN91_007449 [Ooceraea biroi]
MAMEKISLYDGERDILVEISDSSQDAARARNDLAFATDLLNAALNKKKFEEVANSDESIPLIEQSRSVDLEGTSTEERVSDTNISDIEDGDSLCRWTKSTVFLPLETYRSMEEKFLNGKYSQKKVWEKECISLGHSSLGHVANGHRSFGHRKLHTVHLDTAQMDTVQMDTVNLHTVHLDTIAEILKDKNYDVTGPQCSAKMRSLKKSYKSIKDHNSKSGNDRRTWPFYEIMDTIFEKKAWCSPVAVASSTGLSVKSNEESTVVSDSGISSEPSTSKKPVISLLTKRIRQKEEHEEAKKKRHKERMEMDEKLLTVLEKFINK